VTVLLEVQNMKLEISEGHIVRQASEGAAGLAEHVEGMVGAMAHDGDEKLIWEL
jgi:hypothetical protein